MASSQYPTEMRPGVEGALANEEPAVLISRTVEENAGIGFGKAVKQGAADKGCKVADAGSKVVGITVRERSVRPDAMDGNGFARFDSARIMVMGVIWVAVSTNVAAGDRVLFDSATGKFSNA